MFEEVEARLLLSADLLPLAHDTLLAAPATQAAEFRGLGDTGVPEVVTSAQVAPIQRTNELVFVDTQTPEYAQLVTAMRESAAAAGRNLEFVLIDADKDGIRRITDTLAQRGDLDAVHVISHASDGAVQLGNAQLDFETLLKRAGAIKTWGNALTDDGDILFYGCDLAASAEGRSLLDALARLTGADVAASEDPTGHASRGGDWQLEFATGAIEAPVAASVAAQAEWLGLLAPGVTVNAAPGLQTTEAGGTASFTVVLNEAPGADVFIPISSSDTTEGTVSTAQLVFTPGNWNVAQTVTVTGRDDSQPDGNVAYTVVTGDPTSADAGYNALTAGDLANVTVTNVDNERVTAGVVALYLFDEGAGTTIQDDSGFGTALNLTVTDPDSPSDGGTAPNDSHSWGQGYVTTFGPDANTIISSSAAATKIVTAVQASGEITLEAWVQPANVTNYGPARIISMSADTSNRNFQLAQGGSGVNDGDKWNARLRTTTTDSNGNPEVNTADGTADTSLQHVVFTHDAAGNERLYVNGVQIYSGTRTGNFSTWNAGYLLNLANEIGGGRQFLGDMHLAAVYSTALTQAQVQRNYSAGADAHTLVVDTTADYTSADANWGDTSSIGALLQNRGADGLITLREAITAANNTANGATPDRILFNIPGGGLQTITPSGSALPPITDAVNLDATTQEGPAGSPLIVLDGVSTPGPDAILITGAGSSGSTVRGFVIEGFANAAAVRIVGSSNNVVAGNYLGTDPTGTAPGPNLVGVFIQDGVGNRVGGTDPADRNVISGNSIDGVQIIGSAATLNVVQGNFIGTDVDGTGYLGNTNQGVAIINGANANTIGGTASGAGNVISGNGGEGIRITGASTSANVIHGNYIGTDVTGTLDLGNGTDGVQVRNGASGNTVGGSGLGEGNLISGNDGSGVHFSGDSDSNSVRNNLIGTNAAGTGALGNGQHGVWVEGGPNAASSPTTTAVGGIVAGEANTIAFNGGDGVAVTGAAQAVSISGNSIHSNAGLGIDLGNNGVTVNDPGDGDGATGPNTLQNYPTLVQARASGADFYVSGNLDTAAGSYRLHVYANSTADPTGFGEGERYVGYVDIVHPGGDYSFNDLLVNLVAGAPAIGERITVTAMRLSGPDRNTSEFSAALLAVDGATETWQATTAPVIDGTVDAIWSLATMETVGYVQLGTVSGAADLSATFRTLWSASSLYVLVDVTDDVRKDPDNGPEGPWADDIVELYLDTDHSRATAYDGTDYYDEANDFQLGFRWSSITPSFHYGNNSATLTGAISWTVVPTASGYRLEAALPWTSLGLAGAPAGGSSIGLEVHVADDDSVANDREAKLAWTDPIDAAWYNPAAFGTTVLRANSPPVVNDQGFGVAENSANGTVVGTVAASDPDPSPVLTYSITAGNTGGAFAINGSTGELTVANSSVLDFETNPSFSLTVLVTDQYGASDTATVTATVTDVDETPSANDDAYAVSEDGGLLIDGDWSHRRRLTFDNAARPENLVDFPVLVRLDPSRIDYSVMQANGEDLRFYDPDGSPLAYEIESWTPGGVSYVWVKVPRIDASSATDFVWMAYGNATAPAGQNAAAVWTSDYVGVWHLNTGGQDSTANANNGVDTGTSAATGVIGGARDFDGTGDHISVANNASVQLTGPMTIEGWIQLEAFGSADDVDVIVRKGENNPNDYQLAIRNQRPYYVLEGDDDGLSLTGATTLSASPNWYYVVGTWDGATQNIYLNGALDASTAHAPSMSADGRPLYIGGRPGTDLLDGQLDEVRLADVSRSAHWVSAQYASMTDAFVSFGSQQGGVLANDFDVGGDTLTVTEMNGNAGDVGSSVTLPSGAILTLSSAGAVSYNPNGAFESLAAGQTTTDSFTYTIDDGNGGTDTATVTITINGRNDAPTLLDGTLAAVAEDTASPAGQTVGTIFTGLFSDVDSGASLSGIAVVGNTANAGTQGAWQYSTNGGTNWYAIGTVGDDATALALSAGTLVRFVPVADYDGTPPGLTVRGLDDTYAAGFSTTAGSENRVTVDTSSNGGTTPIAAATANLSTTVTPVADAPTLTLSDATTAEDTAVALSLSATSPDADETLSVSITGVPAGASFNQGTDNGGGSWSFTAAELVGLQFAPPANFDGAIALSVTATSNDDGQTATSAAQTLTVTVTPVNDLPTANDDVATVAEDSGASAIGVIANDSFAPDVGETLTIAAVTQGANGSVAITGGGAGLTYTPNANFFGSDSFTYTIDDGNGGTATATVTVTVTSVNDAPVLVTNSFAITAGTPLVLGGGNLGATDVDDAAGPLTFSVTNVVNGRFERVVAPGTAITSFSQTDVLSGAIQFVHSGSGAPAFDLTVSDGAASDGPHAANITFTGVAPPVDPGTPSGGGGGEPGPGPVAEPPLVVATVSPGVAPGVTTPILTTFLRTPSGGTTGGASGDGHGFMEAAAFAPRAATVVAAAEPTVAAATDLPTLRASGDTIDTVQSDATPAEVAPLRAEMRIDSMRHSLDLSEDEAQRIEITLNSVRITGLALSVGAVWWAARAAGLVASLLASSPAWRHVDPLPVLGRDDEEDAEQWDGEETAEERAKRDEEHRAAWVLEGDR